MAKNNLGNLYDLLMSASITNGNDSLMLSGTSTHRGFLYHETPELFWGLNSCRLISLPRM